MSDDRNEVLPEADPEVRADEEAALEEPQAEPQGTEYIEFVGQQPYGTEFTTSHTVSRKDLKDAYDIDLGTKEVVWTKGRNGRFLVKASDMSPEAVEVLENDPMFKRVTLQS